MKLYLVRFSKGYNNAPVSKTVGAKDIDSAIDSLKRYAKANYFSNLEITHVEKLNDIEVFYKTGPIKKRKK